MRSWDNVLGNNFIFNDRRLCIAQGFIAEYFEVAQVLWIGCIVIHLYVSVKLGLEPVQQSIFIFYAVGWGAPAILAIVALILGIYGPADAWCWISMQHGPVLQISFYFVYLWTIGIVDFVLLVLTLRRINIVITNKRSKQRLQLRISLYVIIFMIYAVSYTLWRAHLWIYDEDDEVLREIALAIASIRGVTNAFLYGINRKSIHLWRKKFSRNKLTKSEMSATSRPPSGASLKTNNNNDETAGSGGVQDRNHDIDTRTADVNYRLISDEIEQSE